MVGRDFRSRSAVRSIRTSYTKSRVRVRGVRGRDSSRYVERDRAKHTLAGELPRFENSRNVEMIFLPWLGERTEFKCDALRLYPQ